MTESERLQVEDQMRKVCFLVALLHSVILVMLFLCGVVALHLVCTVTYLIIPFNLVCFFCQGQDRSCVMINVKVKGRGQKEYL